MFVPFCFFVSNAFSSMHCCHLQAVGLDSCESFQEETVSDQDGQYRLRGLQVCLKKNWNMLSSFRSIRNSRPEFTCLWFSCTRHLDNQSRKTCCVFNQSEARHKTSLRTFSRAHFVAHSATGKFLI